MRGGAVARTRAPIRNWLTCCERKWKKAAPGWRATCRRSPPAAAAGTKPRSTASTRPSTCAATPGCSSGNGVMRCGLRTGAAGAATGPESGCPRAANFFRHHPPTPGRVVSDGRRRRPARGGPAIPTRGQPVTMIASTSNSTPLGSADTRWSSARDTAPEIPGHHCVDCGELAEVGQVQAQGTTSRASRRRPRPPPEVAERACPSSMPPGTTFAGGRIERTVRTGTPRAGPRGLGIGPIAAGALGLDRGTGHRASPVWMRPIIGRAPAEPRPTRGARRTTPRRRVRRITSASGAVAYTQREGITATLASRSRYSTPSMLIGLGDRRRHLGQRTGLVLGLDHQPHRYCRSPRGLQPIATQRSATCGSRRRWDSPCGAPRCPCRRCGSP